MLWCYVLSLALDKIAMGLKITVVVGYNGGDEIISYYFWVDEFMNL